MACPCSLRKANPTQRSSGRLLFLQALVCSSERDFARLRSVVFSARYFPEKNKINGIANADHKFWFRVTAFDPETKSMTFLPIRETGWDDNNICLPNVLRSEWPRVLKSIADQEVIEEDKCHMGQFYALTESYRREFFRFLDVDMKAYK